MKLINRIGILAAVLAGFTTGTLAAELQTDWSGGPGVSGPVMNWSDRFDTSTDIAWRSIAGQTALASTPLGTANQSIIAGDANQPVSIATGDLNHDGLVDIVTADPVYDVFGHRGAIYWWVHRLNGTFSRRTVTDDFYGASFVRTADMDLDEDQDVVAAAYYGLGGDLNRNGRYAWFENLDGEGGAWTEHLVGRYYWGAEYVDAGDVDGDGDIDLCGASYLTNGVDCQEGDIVWFENLDGPGTVWESHDLVTEIHGGFEAHFIDMEPDGDLDIFATADGEISWWENLNGDASAWTQHYLPEDLLNVFYADFGDIDNDGDLDVVGSSYSTLQLLWWENLDGQGMSWTIHIIGIHPNGEEVTVADLDGDGDLDAISSRVDLLDGVITWFENITGNGSVWQDHSFQVGFYTEFYVTVADVNGDGRTDAVVASEDFNKENVDQVSWFDLARFVDTGKLTSTILDGQGLPDWGFITWDARVPDGTGLQTHVRASDDPLDLGHWIDVPSSGTALSTLVDPSARYLQYQQIFQGGTDDTSPVVREVRVTTGEEDLVLADPDPGMPGEENILVAHWPVPGDEIVFAYSLFRGSSPVPGCEGVNANLSNPHLLGRVTIDENGEAAIPFFVPNGASGHAVYFQALHAASCTVSNPVEYDFP